jgi:peptidoglycan/LPS O-acetylase OafA/YrhL
MLPPEGAASEVAEKGRIAAAQPLSGAQISNTHVVVFRETMALLYYPLWLLRYQQGARHCRVVVDGRNGSINAGIAPADTRKQVATLAAQVGALAIAAAVLLFFGVTRESGRASLLAAAVIVSVAAVLLGCRFRAEKEVEYHEPFSG